MQSQAQIDQVLRKAADAKEVPGLVAVAATGNAIIYPGAFGKRDLSKDAAMTFDSVFWLASSKMVSADPTLTNDVDLYPHQAKTWGLGFMINTAKTAEGRSAASLAWAGLANTYFWIDPWRDVAGVILMQLLPFLDKPCLDAFASFERRIYAGLEAGRGQKAA